MISRSSLVAVLRWSGSAITLLSVWACTSRTLVAPDIHPTVTTNNVYKSSLNNELDLLFMIDNSQSMAPLQDKLMANFPIFMNVLKALPNGLPDIHVAVVSQDTGPGIYDLPSIHCRYQGDQGLFQYQPRGSCTTPPLAPGQTFLQAAENQTQKNYTGDITDAFTCIAALGEGGCGFEGQLKAVRWALDQSQDDADPPPPGTPVANAGFLRDEAYLGVILITNEDDCSVPSASDLIDPTSIHDADRYGPLWSFRCNEYGHLCTNVAGKPAGTLAAPLRGVNMDLTGCVSNDDPTGDSAHPPGLETRVADEVAFLKGLKADPNQILVAAITGPVTPYNTSMIDQLLPDGSHEMQPNTEHSCMQNNGEYADPAIRIQQWVEAFGRNGLFLPICADSFAPALTNIATALSQLLGPQCVSGPVALNASGVPDCAVNDRFSDPTTKKVVETAIAACAANGNSPPCWTLDPDPMCSQPNQTILNINRGTTPLPNNVSTDVSCALCVPGVKQAGCP